jgi:hypothetical protein
MMAALELLDQELQTGITDSERLEFFYGGDDVVATGARPAVALPYKVKLLGKAEAPGILAVTTINDIAKGVHALLRVVLEPDPAPRLAVDPSDLLAAAQVFNRFHSFGGGYPIGDTATIAAPIQTEDQARLFRLSAMHERVNAQGAVGTHKTRIASLQKIEPGAPHQ